MAWVEVFTVFAVTHLVGDFIFQTEFQALNKHGGLGRDAVKRRALAQHTLCYTACFVPALIWLADDVSVTGLVAAAAAIGVPHGLQDDGRVVKWWMRSVKHTPVAPGVLGIFVDQSFHMVALLLLAFILGT